MSDTDSELQNDLLSGKLTSGLYKLENPPKQYVHNKHGLATSTNTIKTSYIFPQNLVYLSKNIPLTLDQDKLDLNSLFDEVDKKTNRVEEIKKEKLLAKNDFQRENYFYNLAQSSIQNILPQVKSCGIMIERPNDYFAEMVKSDDHMNKIKKAIFDKQARLEIKEKVVSSRREKNFKKKLEKAEATQKRATKSSQLKKLKLWKNKNAGALGEEIIKGTDINDLLARKGHSNSSFKKKLSKKALYKLQKFGQTGLQTAVQHKSSNKSLKPGYQKRNNMKLDDVMNLKSKGKFSKNELGTKSHKNFNKSKPKRKLAKKRPGKKRRVKLKSIANIKN